MCLFLVVRDQLKELTKQYDKSENDLKALQSVGQVNLEYSFNKGLNYIDGLRFEVRKISLYSFYALDCWRSVKAAHGR